MKTMNQILSGAAIALAFILNAQPAARAQGATAFTFQGRLNTVSGAANGSYDLTFAVWDANVAGDRIAGPVTNAAVTVSNGLFTVALDFGPGVFTGTNYWVEMAVATNGSGSFVTLVPRQPLTPAPYALNLSAPQTYGLCPPGSVMAYMGASAPPGWLLCDGSAVSRAQYAALFAVLGTACGAGNGSNTFNLPDCRGVFLRGVDGGRGQDPDVAARTAEATGGNTGNAVGSYQADMFRSHNHDNGSLTCGNVTALPGYEPYGIASQGAYGCLSPVVGTWDNIASDTGWTGSTGGNETRPKNIYVNYLIKY